MEGDQFGYDGVESLENETKADHFGYEGVEFTE